jgi:hypothetical protein
VESMNGARFVHDTLEAQGWDVLVADAQRVKGLAPLACKTDKSGAGPRDLGLSLRARTPDSVITNAQYRQIARRRGPNKEALVVAHSLIELAWHLLSTGELFKDLGDDYFTARQDPERRTRRLVAQLEELGFTVTLETTSATAA